MPAPAELAIYRSASGHQAVLDWTRAAQARLGYLPGPHVVLLHPLSSNDMMWGPHIAALAGQSRVYVPDTIGMAGRSATTRPDEPDRLAGAGRSASRRLGIRTEAAAAAALRQPRPPPTACARGAGPFRSAAERLPC